MIQPTPNSIPSHQYSLTKLSPNTTKWQVIVGNMKPVPPPGVWAPADVDQNPAARIRFITSDFTPAAAAVKSWQQAAAGGGGEGSAPKFLTTTKTHIGTDIMPSPAEEEEEQAFQISALLQQDLARVGSASLPPSHTYPHQLPLPDTAASPPPGPLGVTMVMHDTRDATVTAAQPAAHYPTPPRSLHPNNRTTTTTQGNQPLKWEASSNAALQLHDPMTGLRLNRNMPPPVIKHVPLVPASPNKSRSTGGAPRGAADPPLPTVDEPVVLRPLRATGKVIADAMPYGPVTAGEKYAMVKERTALIQETPKWAFIESTLPPALALAFWNCCCGRE
jgi:hypothetical protein